MGWQPMIFGDRSHGPSHLDELADERGDRLGCVLLQEVADTGQPCHRTVRPESLEHPDCHLGRDSPVLLPVDVHRGQGRWHCSGMPRTRCCRSWHRVHARRSRTRPCLCAVWTVRVPRHVRLAGARDIRIDPHRARHACPVGLALQPDRVPLPRRRGTEGTRCDVRLVRMVDGDCLGVRVRRPDSPPGDDLVTARAV